MAPGPNLCRLERTSAVRQTWRVGTRSPGDDPGLSCFRRRFLASLENAAGPPRNRKKLSGLAGAVRVRGAMAAAPLHPPEERGLVEVDVAERGAEQLQGVAGQR